MIKLHNEEKKYWVMLVVACAAMFVPQVRIVAPFIIGFALAKIVNEGERRKANAKKEVIDAEKPLPTKKVKFPFKENENTTTVKCQQCNKNDVVIIKNAPYFGIICEECRKKGSKIWVKDK